MATILVVVEEGVLAGQMVRTLRQAGHLPRLVSSAQAALREVSEQPGVILLDLELPDAALLARLHSQPETAGIPVLAITSNREAALHLQWEGRVAEVLRKPVSGTHLREAVDRIVATHGQLIAEARRLDRQRQGELIRHLLVKGSDPLALHIAQRVCADRTCATGTEDGTAISWADIAAWGIREGLLDAEQAQLLCRMPMPPARGAHESGA